MSVTAREVKEGVVAKPMKDRPFRTLVDAVGRADWLRSKRYGQLGYVEPREKPRPPEEKFVPLERPPKKAVYAWRANDHAPLPKPIGPPAREFWRLRRGKKPNAGPTYVRAVAKDETPPSEPHVPAPLPVPTPSERVAPTVSAPARDGQTEFRAMILAAYGTRCAITGCTVECVLEAAHIVPYVDARSNLVSNGICLRADIHKLFDRNLIRIDSTGRVVVDAEVVALEYRELHGRVVERLPDVVLLGWRMTSYWMRQSALLPSPIKNP